MYISFHVWLEANGMFSSLYTSGRKSATTVLDWMQRTETRPYEEWRRDWVRVNEEIARADEQMLDFGSLSIELDNRGRSDLASQFANDYANAKFRRDRLFYQRDELKEERDRRGWYSKLRRWLMP